MSLLFLGIIEAMIISEAQLDGFIELYKREFNEVLDRATAHMFALKLVQLMSIVYFDKRVPSDTHEDDMIYF